MTTYNIEPTEETLHAYFSNALVPALTIDPGDTVNFKTLDAGRGYALSDAGTIGDRLKMEFTRRDGGLGGHALCGAIYINDAKPGMTLEIQINEVMPGDYGYTFAGGFSHMVNKALDLEDEDEFELLWSLDKETGLAINQYGQSVEMNPFPGVMGVAPAEEGRFSTSPPRKWGGNLDCKELVAGTTLYLPVGVEGALFSTGDGHAAQGDGEVSVTAIECPMERISLTFNLRDDMSPAMPQARVHGGYITMGVHEDLWQATTMALDAMVAHMMAKYDVPKKHALALASVVVDMRITQIANGTLGVHAFLSDDAIHTG